MAAVEKVLVSEARQLLFFGRFPKGEIQAATVDKMLDLNYRSAFFIARAVLPHMRRREAGASWPWQAGGRSAGRHARGIQRFESGAGGTGPHHRAGEQGPLHLGEYGAAGYARRTGPPTRKPIHCSASSRRRWQHCWCTRHQMLARR